MQDDFSIVNLTKIKISKLAPPKDGQAFLKLKNDILGKKYSLSIAYVPLKKSKELNKTYRNKDKATNILSFPLRKNEGEIILCPSLIKSEAKNFEKTFNNFLIFLVIHGMLHLKGMKHSSTMERAEKKYDKKYYSWNRHRLIDDEGRCGRILQRRKKS